MNIKQQFKDSMKKYWPIYLFVILAAYSMLHTYECPANQYRDPYIDQFEKKNISCFENQIEMGFLNDFPKMNAEYDACDTYTKKRDFHKKNAERCFNDAKNMCWYFPSKVRDKSLFAFSNVASLATLKDLKSKAIATLVITLIEYGADAYEEWTNMNTKLHWAEYHWDQYEFFCDVVKAGNLRLQ